VTIFIYLTEVTFTCNVAVQAPINSRCFTCSSLHKTWHFNNSGSFEVFTRIYLSWNSVRLMKPKNPL